METQRDLGIGEEAITAITGNKPLDAEGKTLIVEDSKVETLAEPVTVYNFKVEDFHTYHVGEKVVLVHNAGDAYSRPSGFRKGVREETWKNAQGDDGIVRDPLTKKPMDPNEPWDMGHKPGHEFKKHQNSARERGISRSQFLDEYNDPSHYRPELPSSNRSHMGEDKTGLYLGS